MKFLVLVLGVLFFQTGDFWSATWLSKWAFFISLCIGAMCWVAAEKTNRRHLPLLLFTFGSLLTIGLWPHNPYQDQVDAITLLALHENALYAILSLSACVLLITSVARKDSLWVNRGLRCIWAIGTLGYLIIESPPDNGLWFGNPSMGMGLLACLLPFVWQVTQTPRLITWGLTLWAIYRTRTSVPWGVLGVVTATYWMAWKPAKAWLLGIPALAIGMIWTGKHLLGQDFWDQNGRFEIWSMAWDWFKTHGSLLWGMGFSTQQILLPAIQQTTGHYHGAYFLWLHNDWLQILIEGGLLGAVCVLLSVSRLLWISKTTPDLFAALCGFMTLGLFNYPLRLPIHCVCLCLIIGSIEASARPYRRNAYESLS